MSNHFVAKLVFCAVLAFLPLTAAYGTAYTIDLTNTSASQTINSAIFTYDNIASGSGGYTSMFRVQATGTEQGYNYDGTSTPIPFDQSGGVSVPHQLLSSMPVVTIGGVQYIHLNFDANNSNGLTLTDFRMYVNNGGTPIYVTSTASLSSLGTLVYDFNAGGANTLQMTAFKSGSGTDDMAINIPLSVVVGQGFDFNTATVYYFATMTSTQGGFEEFAVDKSLTTTVASTLFPEPQTIWGGAGMAVLALGSMVVARRRKAAEGAIAAV